MSNPNDFVIENGVLKEYKGPGGDVIIPDGVTEIGEQAFCFCEDLTSVTIPEGVTGIEVSAFFECDELEKVSLPDSLLNIGYGAFKECKKLMSVHFPEGLRIVDDDAFSQCVRLKEAELPAGLSNIGNYAFNGCQSIEYLQIPDTITKLGSATFAGCKALRSVALPDGLTIIGTACFGSCECLESAAIPPTVKTIEDRAFSGCKALSEVVLPEGLESIGEKAFAGCNKRLILRCSAAIFGMLDKETKDNLTMSWLAGIAEFSTEQTSAIKKYAGRAMQRLLTELDGDDEEALTRLLSCGKVKPENLVSCIQKYNDGQHPKMMAVLLEHQNKAEPIRKTDEIISLEDMTTEDLAKNYRWTEDTDGIVISKYKGIESDADIPAQIDGKPVVRIGKNAFKGNIYVRIIRMPDSVTEILESAFEKCSALVEVRWSECLRIIGKRAFDGCEGLSGTLVLPRTVKTLGASAFAGCGFTEIELPEGLESIGVGSLEGSNYSELHIPASVIKMTGCTGFFTGDLYIHGMNTKIDTGYYDQMPMTIHAPAGSYVAKCAEKGMFACFQVM